MDYKNYIRRDQRPHTESVGETYPLACEELLLPAPSVRIPEWPEFSHLTGGFRPKEFSILCGATGVGKTTWVANLSAALLHQGISHFVASVETGRTDFVKRVMSAHVKEDWNTGEPVSVEKLKRYNEKYMHIMKSEKLHLSLYENRFSADILLSDIAWMVETHGIQIAIIDNLNFFLEVTKSSDQIVEMDRVIHNLIIFCKQAPVHVIMIMHPKKTDNTRVNSEFDIKGSSTAVQEAHNIFLLNRASEEAITKNLAARTDRELFIAKMRRRGKAAGTRIFFKSNCGVEYIENGIMRWL